ncbi:MAG: tetratricopeptide repeat protein [Phycisphaerales bacterium]|nr:MAG: tetratricopeptide repeat protein [Phycisphaerales bacterium]
MSIRFRALAALASLVAYAGCATTGGPKQVSHSRGQLFDHMGPYARTVSTGSAEAQRYFEQGLTWYYAFNHDEAIRSFRRAAELDPDCAMAWWGAALSEGPNYNDPVMTEARSAAAWDALQEALARIDRTTPVERALIEALEHRYANPWPQDRASLDRAYSEAMAKVWAAWPNDPDVGTLYAESLMVQMPWKLYTLDFKPAADTPTIVATLERVMALAPQHPGASHLYIHAVEPSDDPYRGLVAAERLNDAVPASGHLLHMPSHIYVKTGRWNEAIVQNEKAMRSDDKYRKLSPEQGIQHMYMVHNAHMLAYAAMMCGREKEAMKAARAMWADLPAEALESLAPYLDLWMASVYDVQKRFGRWDAILTETAPPTCLPITTAVWRAHRAIACAARKDIPGAEREYEAFRQARAAVPEESVFGQDPTHRILEVSERFIAGEIALQQGQWDRAAELLEQAAEVEDTLSYGEPPQWLQPVRHTLGAVYLKSGRYADAERVYREDLAKWPGNGWSLYGLSRALEGQGSIEEARKVKDQFERAWARADERTTTSCKCIPTA